MKKKKEVINEKLLKQSKQMICAFTILGVVMVSAILLSATVNRGTYSVDTTADKPYWCCFGGNDCWASATNVSSTTVTCNYYGAVGGECPSGTHNYCPDLWSCTQSGGCYTWNCIKGSEGCEGYQPRYAAFYNWDGVTPIGSCEIINGIVKNCTNVSNICSAWSTMPGQNSGVSIEQITSEGPWYCAADYSVHANCCTNTDYVTKHDCEAGGGTWTCQNDNPASGTSGPGVASNPTYACYWVEHDHKYVWALNQPTGGVLVSRDAENCDKCEDGYIDLGEGCIEQTVRPPVSEPPASDPTQPPTNPPTNPPESGPAPTSRPNDNIARKACYTCTLNGKSQSVYATSKGEAAKGATTLSGVTADNCKIISEDNCKPILVENCYECKQTGKNNKYVTANSVDDAKSKSGYGTCTITNSNKCNTSVNPQTGTVYIVLAWIVGIFTIGYSFWYFKKMEKK